MVAEERAPMEQSRKLNKSLINGNEPIARKSLWPTVLSLKMSRARLMTKVYMGRRKIITKPKQAVNLTAQSCALDSLRFAPADGLSRR